MCISSNEHSMHIRFLYLITNNTLYICKYIQKEVMKKMLLLPAWKAYFAQECQCFENEWKSNSLFHWLNQFATSNIGAATFSTTALSITTLSIAILYKIEKNPTLGITNTCLVLCFTCYAECHHAEFRCAECCYAECRRGECQGAATVSEPDRFDLGSIKLKEKLNGCSVAFIYTSLML